jgi:hypothetical protein
MAAGGGGAYLVGTHQLWDRFPRLDLTQSYQRRTKARPETVAPPMPPGAGTADLRATYPDERTSRRLSVQVLWRMFANWPFGLFLAAVYGVATLIEGHALRAAAAFQPGLAEVLSRVSPVCVTAAGGCPETVGVGYFASALARSPSVWAVVALLLVCCWSLPAHQPLAQRTALAGALAVGHAAAFFAGQGVFHAIVVRPGVLGPGDPVFVPAYVAWVAMCGYVLGLTVCAVYLLVASWFGVNHNELFAAMRLTSHKCFLRLRLASDGTLTVYPLGIEQPPAVRLTPLGRLSRTALRSYRVDPALIEEPVRVSPRW